jgi:hypothetical protein
MQRIFGRLLFLTFILSACNIGVAPPPAVPVSTTQAPAPIPTTPAPSGSEQCGYQWASQTLPELSNSFQQSIQVLQTGAQANAYAYGENCVRADGTIASFSAMETDFNVALQVNDLTNEADLGDWIVKVMQVITAIPKEQIVGPQPGRVTITFQSNESQKVLNFYINQYQALPAGLSNSDIYKALQTPQ